MRRLRVGVAAAACAVLLVIGPVEGLVMMIVKYLFQMYVESTHVTMD